MLPALSPSHSLSVQAAVILFGGGDGSSGPPGDDSDAGLGGHAGWWEAGNHCYVLTRY
jgi:hypothetical protein